MREQNFSLHHIHRFLRINKFPSREEHSRVGPPPTPPHHPGEQDSIRVPFCMNGSVGNKVNVSFKFYSQCALSLSYRVATWKLSEKLVTCLQSIKLEESALLALLQAHTLPTGWKPGCFFPQNIRVLDTRTLLCPWVTVIGYFPGECTPSPYPRSLPPSAQSSLAIWTQRFALANQSFKKWRSTVPLNLEKLTIHSLHSLPHGGVIKNINLLGQMHFLSWKKSDLYITSS